MPNVSVKLGQKNSADILIYDYIGPEWMGMISAKSIADALNGMNGVEKINVHINSGGGYVFEGLAIYNLLSKHPANVTVSIDGAAISIASIVAMAGDTVQMASNAMFMIHDPWTIAQGNAADIRKEADVLDQLKGNLVDVYAAKTGMKTAEIADLLTAETWMQADEALAMKFVDEVTANKGALNSVDLDLSGFKNAPAWATAKAPPQKSPESPWKIKMARRRLDLSMNRS